MCCAVCHTAGVFVRFFARPKKLTEETALLKRRRGYRFIRQRGFL
jgi:lauroyl/myristoyl acyltransferase